eukprot:TRINITY_DN16182_c0_g1_i3.p1 TRINITY_DN16182_c0_g1~~TRINITY_DN16182_c0_g1_i3.p1  ORF type:complete len:412 (+),score=61.00 TRINITY_DN16182_c0_g1_i3:69-1238(+)
MGTLLISTQSWVTASGRWSTECIGGDSRYWPAGSWIMHLEGPQGFEGRPELCDQYQWRLDVYGLGVTALELLCAVACAAPSVAMSGVSSGGGAQDASSARAWQDLAAAWQRYHSDAWQWWSSVHSVISCGGDITKVQQQLLQEGIVEKHLALITDLRSALRTCAVQQHTEQAVAEVLQVIADMLDEHKELSCKDVAKVVGPAPEATPVGSSGPASAGSLLGSGTLAASAVPGAPARVAPPPSATVVAARQPQSQLQRPLASRRYSYSPPPQQRWQGLGTGGASRSATPVAPSPGSWTQAAGAMGQMPFASATASATAVRSPSPQRPPQSQPSPSPLRRVAALSPPPREPSTLVAAAAPLAGREHRALPTTGLAGQRFVSAGGPRWPRPA